MQFAVAAAVAALAVMVDAKASFTNVMFSLQAGVPFNLTWSGGVAPYQIELDNGPATNLKKVQDLTTTSEMNYVYTPPSSLPSDKYAFKITDESGEPNYSLQWNFQGSASSSATPSSAASTNRSAATSSSPASPMTSLTTSLSNSTYTNSSTSSDASAAASKTSSAAALSTSTTIANTNEGQRIASPVALLMLFAAGLALFN